MMGDNGVAASAWGEGKSAKHPPPLAPSHTAIAVTVETVSPPPSENGKAAHAALAASSSPFSSSSSAGAGDVPNGSGLRALNQPNQSYHHPYQSQNYNVQQQHQQQQQQKQQYRQCWQMFLVCSAVTVCVVFLTTLRLLNSTRAASINAFTGAVELYSFHYFFYCTVGGALAGLAHYVLTPLDLVKCRMQVGRYGSMRQGLVTIVREELEGASAASSSFSSSTPSSGGAAGSSKYDKNGTLGAHTDSAGGHRSKSGEFLPAACRPLRSVLCAVNGLYRGGVPTFIAYILQGAFKYGIYEFLKFQWGGGPSSSASAPPVWLTLAASCCAELVADVALVPWESVKIQMQVTLAPTDMRGTMTAMWAKGGLGEFFRGLPALWCRQIPYTMMKFASFEKAARFLQLAAIHLLLAPPKAGASAAAGSAGLGSGTKLLISLLAGVVAGVLCTLVSHPPDTLLSKLNNPRFAGGGVRAAYREAGGWRGLWKGLLPRMVMASSITALQWVIYDSFKVAVGLPTTGSVPPPSAAAAAGAAVVAGGTAAAQHVH